MSTPERKALPDDWDWDTIFDWAKENEGAVIKYIHAHNSLHYVLLEAWNNDRDELEVGS
jgi:hypothetical protein